jgi:hypothetical protein
VELSTDFDADLVTGLELVLGPAPVGPKISFTPTPVADQQSGGIHFQAGTEQVDQDPDPKFVLRFPENLFGQSRTFQFFLQAPDFTSPPFAIRANLLSARGRIATAEVSMLVTGDPITLGPSSRGTVLIQIACQPGITCLPPADAGPAPNRPPVMAPINGGNPISISVGHTLTITLDAFDPDGDVLTYSADRAQMMALVGDKAFDPATQTFTYTPTMAAVRTDPYPVTFTVADPHGGTDMKTVSIVVVQTGSTFFFQPLAALVGLEGERMTIRIGVNNPDSVPLTFTLDQSGLPPGLPASFDSVSMMFNWVPAFGTARPAPYPVTFTATGMGRMASMTTNIIVIPNDRPPILSLPATLTVKAGVRAAVPFDVSDPDGDRVTVTLDSSALPAGNDAAVAGTTLSWTPKVADVRPDPYVAKLTANDGRGGVTTASIGLVVSMSGSAPLFTPISLQRVVEGRQLSFIVKATDPDMGMVTTTMDATGLPPGSPAFQSGIFAWTPSVGTARQEPYGVKFTATDTTSLSTTMLVTIAVDPDRGVGVPSSLAIGTQPVNITAGSPLPAVTARVLDETGSLASTSTILVTATLDSNPSSGMLAGTTSVNAAAGIATFNNLRLDKAGTGYTLRMSSPGVFPAISNAFNVTPGAADHLVFAAQPMSVAPGATMAPVVVDVVDSVGNPTPASGQVHIALAANPAGATLSGTADVAAPNGVATFSNLSVSRAATGLHLVATFGTLGMVQSDAFDVITGFDGGVHDGGVQDGGVRDGGAQDGGAQDGGAQDGGAQDGGAQDGGAQDGGAQDGGAQDGGAQDGGTGPLLAPIAPGTVTAGVAANLTLKAIDALGNPIITYRGTVHFTSSDSAATLPANYTFTAGDQGVHVFTGGLTLRTVGSQTVTATDTAMSGVNGTQTGIQVVPGGAAKLLVTNVPSPTIAGVANDVEVTVLDAFNNYATGYTGTIHFTSSDSTATLPANYTFAAGDQGKHLFSGGVTFHAGGTQSVTATDTADATITGTQPGISVCVPETDSAFCARLGKNCDPLNGTDNCGSPRSVTSCGTCPADQHCAANVCACNETDTEMCYRLAISCGPISGTDRCGFARNISSCGTCNAALGSTCQANGLCTPICSTLPFSIPGNPVPEMSRADIWDAIQAITPDTLSTVYVGGVTGCGGCGNTFLQIGDRADRSSSFTFVTPTGLGTVYNSDRGFEITPDGLTLIFINGDTDSASCGTPAPTGFLQATRSARGQAAFSTPVQGDFVNINAQLAGFGSGATPLVPVLSADGLAFYYLVYGAQVPDGGTNPNGTYESLRTSTSTPFPAGTRMPSPLSDYTVSAISYDRLTLFVETGDYFLHLFTRTHVSLPFTNPNLPAIGMQNDFIFRSHINDACSELWTTWAPGGCFREDTHKLTRCMLSCPSGQCSNDTCVSACSAFAFAAPNDTTNRIVSNAGQDALEGVRGDGLTYIYGKTGGCGGAFMPTVADWSGMGYTERLQSQLAGILRGGEEGFALSLDGTTLVGLHPDSKGITQVTRVGSGTDFGTSINDTPFAAINSQIAALGSTTTVDNPVLGGLDRNLLYRVSNATNAANNGYYEAVRSDTTQAFPAGTRLTSTVVQGTGGMGSLSADGRTLFTTYPTPSSPPNFWVTHAFSRTDRLGTFPDTFTVVGDPNPDGGASVFRPKITADCKTLFANGRQSGCSLEDIYKLPQP